MPSSVVQANIDELVEREKAGLIKYGVTLENAQLTHEALLQHGLEEALDLANYLRAAMMTTQVDRKNHEELLGLLAEFREELSKSYRKISTDEVIERLDKLLDTHNANCVLRELKNNG